MILCANHAGTSAIVRIAITNVQTTTALTANVEVDWLNISIVINRLQFPLRLAYAMTFNKSQGQTLEKVLIDGTAQHLPGRGSINGAFMHGHCNVALSRVRNRESLAILVDETNLVTDPTTGKRAARTTNIVCRKILDV